MWISRRPSGLRKTKYLSNSLAHRTTWLRPTSFVILGVTGGAGSGKTTVVKRIQELVDTRFLHCDVIAHELMEPGGASYEALVQEFGEEILEPAKEECMEQAGPEPMLRPISRPYLAAVAMATPESRKRLNELTHPLVRQAVERELERLTREKFSGVVVIEAALLIEAGYKEICDSLWYVHAPLKDRVRRMRKKRGYSEEKIKNILAGQLTDEQFKAAADVVIENPDGENDEAGNALSKEIWKHLKEYLESTDKM